MIQKNLCDGCSKCCEYVALEIDKPENIEDFEQIRWFLLHKDVWVFIDNDDSWNLQFNTTCEKLEDTNCDYYKKRPGICRGYTLDTCERNGSGKSFKILWKSESEFTKWLKKNKPKFVPDYL